MLQDLGEHVYHNEFCQRAPRPEDRALLFTPQRELLCARSGGELMLPQMKDVSVQAAQYAFSIDETGYYLVQGAPRSAAFSLQPTAVLRAQTDRTSPALFAAAAGESLYRWYTGQRFCGRCGARMQHSRTERAMVCPDCGSTVYPKICPAVIVAVVRGERLLLTRYRGRPFKKYALVAGFNEIGESIEATVHREVMEEVGLRVKNLRFYKSQPWVFTDSLLMGFVCELDGSERITLQEDELAEAGWFARDELPEDYSHISLTGELIEQFRLGRL